MESLKNEQEHQQMPKPLMVNWMCYFWEYSFSSFNHIRNSIVYGSPARWRSLDPFSKIQILFCLAIFLLFLSLLLVLYVFSLDSQYPIQGQFTLDKIAALFKAAYPLPSGMSVEDLSYEKWTCFQGFNFTNLLSLGANTCIFLQFHNSLELHLFVSCIEMHVECEDGIRAYRKSSAFKFESAPCTTANGVLCEKEWTEWGEFSACSSTCAQDSVRIRYRECTGLTRC